MKKQLLTSILLISSTLLAPQIMSCSKITDKVTASTTSLDKGKSSVTANLSGAYTGNFKSHATLSSVAKSSMIINIGAATSSVLGGTGGTTEQFMILLPANISVGTYNTKNQSGTSFTYVGSNGASASGWSSGALETNIVYKVTKATSEEIEGTFEGSMGEEEKNTKVSVNGTFAAKF